MNDEHDDGTADSPDRGQARDGNGRFAQSFEGAERDARAVELRTRGMTLDQVAAELGYSHASAAAKAVSRALAAVQFPSVAEYREMQNRQLDTLTATTIGILERPHPVVTASGRIATDPVTGETLQDPAVELQCVRVLVQIAERRAKLLGLDAPVKQELTLEWLNSRIPQLQTELGGRRELEAGASTADERE
jgi:hypothetical protein